MFPLLQEIFQNCCEAIIENLTRENHYEQVFVVIGGHILTLLHYLAIQKPVQYCYTREDVFG